MKTKRFLSITLSIMILLSLLPHAFAAEDIAAMLAEYQKQAQAMQQEVIAQQEAARQDLALAQQQATQQVQQAQADMQKAYKQATCKHEWKRTYTEDKDETDGVHDEVTVCIDCEKELERVTVEDEKEQTATLRTALKAAPALRSLSDTVYTVTLKAGDGTGSDIIIRSDEADNVAASQATASNGQFWDEGDNGIWFKFPDCPFEAPDNSSFVGWKFDSNGENLAPGLVWKLTETQLTLTATWQKNVIYADYELSVPLNVTINGTDITVIPITATKLVFGQKEFAGDDPVHGHFYIDTDTFVLKYNVVELKNDKGDTISFSNNDGGVEFYAEGTKTISVSVNPDDYASAAPGIYTGTLNYYCYWEQTKGEGAGRSSTIVGSGSIALTLMGPDTEQFNVSVTASPSEGGTVTGGGTYYQDSSVTVKATSNAGYFFSGWTENGTQVSTDAEYSFIATADRNLVANFEVAAPSIAYTVILSPGTGGGNPITFNSENTDIAENKQHAENCQFYYEGNNMGFRLDNSYCPNSFTAPEGKFLFDGWNGSTEYNILNTTTTSYETKWRKVDYIVTVINDGNGTGYANPGGGSARTSISLTAVPNDGYIFDFWELVSGGGFAGKPTANPYTFRLRNDDAVVKAHFKRGGSYNVNVAASPAEGGTVTGAGTYYENSTVTVSASPGSGYRFVNWSSNDGVNFADANASTTTFKSPAHDVTVTANFEVIPATTTYTVSASVNDNIMGTVTGAGTYDAGATVTLTATANEGYTFVNWTENGSVIQGAGATYSFTAEADRNLVANFAEKETVAAPTFDPAEGTFTAAQSITISCATEGATIYYTSDGTEPTTGSTVYNEPISVSTTSTIKAIAVKDGWTNSAVTEATYTIKVTPASYSVTVSVNDSAMGTASASPASGTAGTEVTLTATPKEGYRFKEWQVTSGNVTITDNKFTIGTENVAVQAVFEAIPSGKQDIDLRIEVPDKTYGDDVKCTVYASVDGEYTLKINGKQAAVTVRNHLANYNAGPFDAGSYQATIEFSGNDNYNPAFAITAFTVYPIGTSFGITADPAEAVFGESISIKHTLSDGALGTIKYYLQDGKVLGELDVSESLELPVLDAGAYVVIAQYLGDYNFLPSTDTVLVTIKPADISAARVEAANQTYNASALTPDPTVKLGNTELVKDTNYTVSYTNNINAGSTATVTVTGKGNYTGTASGNFTIQKAQLTITANPQTYTYNGQIQGPGDTAYEDPAKIDKLFTVEGLKGSDAVTSIMLDGQGKDVGVYTGEEGIVPSGARIVDADGKDVTDNYDIHYVNGKLIIEAPSYTLSVTAPTFEAVTEDYTQPAAKEITITSDGNSNATISSVTVDSTNFTITNGDTTVQAGGTNETYKIQPKEGLASGTYTATITVTYDGGDTATAKVSFKVNALDAVATPTFDPAAKEYKEAQNVTISCATEGATIYYTTDGATPTTSSTLYTAPITVSADTTIKAIAVKDCMKNSDVATAAYTITPEYTVSTAVSPDNSGTVTADKAAAKEGETVTLTATPAEGYELVSITYTPEGGTATDITSAKSFTMPAENVTVTATFKLKTFTIKFVNDDGTELQSVTVAYGETPAYTGKTPVKPADTDYTYTFRGWEPAIASVTGEATYRATYTATKNEYTFTYTWSEDNSTVTAMRTCTNNPDLSVTEVVKTTSEGTAATCEAAGKVTYTAEFTNAAFEKQTKTVETPALGHEWMVREELWAGDYSSVTVTFVCENDPTHTKKETAASAESISGSVVTYTAAITLDGKKFPFSKSVDIAGQGYVFTQTTQIWVKGSTEGATFRVTRLGDDRWTYRLFTGIRVDGAPVSAYSKAPGSIILTLHPAYLESLSVGYHTLAVYFTDGEATADFLILPAGGSYYNNSTSERYTYVPPSNVPRTGDDGNLMLWGVLAIVSLAGVVLTGRKREKQ